MNVDESTLESALGMNLVKSVTKAILVIAAVIFLAYLSAFIPGTEYLVPIDGIDGGIIMGSLLTIIVIGLLLYLSSALGQLAELVLNGPQPVVEGVASIVRWLMVLVAVLVTHVGFSPMMTMLLGEATWIFDVVALSIAVPILAIIALRLYLVLDPVSAIIANRVTDPTD